MSVVTHSAARSFGARSFSNMILLISCLFWTSSVFGFDNSRSDNLAVYWGQDSYGATHSDQANGQQRLVDYCNDDTIDAFPLAFVNVFFGADGLPGLDLSNTCGVEGNGAFAGTDLPKCSFMASDIETCQSKGKIVTLSLGGGGASVGFTSDAQAQQLADNIWNTFLGGSSDTRPFGSAVLDGVDLDIEGGSPAHYAAFVSQIRSHTDGASKKYYVTGAPQCPFPDANMGETLNAVAFDAVYVQFYNNYCGLQAFNDANDWNFGTWDNWAKTQAPNKDVKIYIGAPASSTAAGSGYISAESFASIIKETQSKYSSFGGVMLWDASQAYANNRYDQAVKSALTGSSDVPPAPTSSSSTHKASSTVKATSTAKASSTVKATSAKPTSTNEDIPSPTGTSSAAKSTSTATGGVCASAKAWDSTAIYLLDDQVTYDGQLWQAKWWTQGDNPDQSGEWGVWASKGSCASSSSESKQRMVRRHAHVARSHGHQLGRAHVIAAPVPVENASTPTSSDSEPISVPVLSSNPEVRILQGEVMEPVINSRLFRL